LDGYQIGAPNLTDARDVELAKKFGQSMAIDLSIEIVGWNTRKVVEGHKKVALKPC
jgi:hypothetical protein